MFSYIFTISALIAVAHPKLTDAQNLLSEVEEESNTTSYVDTLFKNGCLCAHYECDCCTGVDIEKIGLNATLCTDLAYLPDEYGIEMKLMLNKYVLYEEKISARNPPPVCFGKPYTLDMAEVCLRFRDLDVSKVHLSGCLTFQAIFEHVTILNKVLSCFNMTRSAKEDHSVILVPVNEG